MFPEDRKLFEHFDREGKKITGYPYAGDVYWDYANAGREFREREEDREIRGFPLFGHSPDFGYLYYGAVWYGDEIWSGGRVKDYNGDGKITDLEILRWNDEELGSRYFRNWQKYNHPQLGGVEIGGFNPKFFRQNPPPERLEEWARKEALFNILLAKSLPQVKVVSASIRPVKKEPGMYDVVAVFTNEGFLPTALEMAKRVKIVRPDWAELKLAGKGAELSGGKARQEIGSLSPNETREVRWKIKVTNRDNIQAEVTIGSTRGGLAKKTIPM